jgi:hypothetical protein
MADENEFEGPAASPLPEGRWAPSSSGPGYMQVPSTAKAGGQDEFESPPQPTLAEDVGKTAATQAAKGVVVDIPALPGTVGQIGELLSEYGAERQEARAQAGRHAVHIAR